MEFRKVAAEVVADSPEWEFGIPLEVDTVPVVDKEGRLLDILAELDKAGSVVVDSLALDCTMDREGWNWDTFSRGRSGNGTGLGYRLGFTFYCSLM